MYMLGDRELKTDEDYEALTGDEFLLTIVLAAALYFYNTVNREPLAVTPDYKNPSRD